MKLVNEGYRSGTRFTKYINICPKIIVRSIASLAYVLHLWYCMIYLTVIVTMS